MTGSEIQFERIIKEIEKLLMKDVPLLKNEAYMIERSESFDLGAFNKNNVKLDLLRKRYTELCIDACEIDKKRATKEIKNILKNKKLLVHDPKETSEICETYLYINNTRRRPKKKINN